jgi:hypothetical protein
MARTLHGGCYCGRVRLELRAVFDCGYCHCDDCRRTTGAPVAVSVVARAEDVAVSGEPAAHARAHGVQRFCPVCGTPVCYEFCAGVGDLVSIGVGVLETPDAVVPRFHQFASHHLSWLHIHDTLPKYADNRLPHPVTRGGAG